VPTYQYACTNSECGNRFELVQSFTDPAATECPVCEGPVRKVFSAVGVVFKGSGFYRTDSRVAAKKSGNGKSKSAEPSSTSDSSSGSAASKPTSSASSGAPAAAAASA
jgi:putative FmdB family regulatory protein